MFWCLGGRNTAIDNLLAQPDVTLTKILDEDEVLSEIHGGNKKLLEFLLRPQSMSEMVDLITTLPSADIALPLQYKYRNTSCQVLSSDPTFTEKIATEDCCCLLEKLLYFFRDSEPPLNPLLASYVGRVLGEMFVRKPGQNLFSYHRILFHVMGYLKSQPCCLDWLKHLETSAVCEFLHKMITNVASVEDEPLDIRANFYDWLVTREKFFMKLVESMDKQQNRETHENVSQLVGDLLLALQDESTCSPDSAGPFLLALGSGETFGKLLDIIFSEDNLSQSSIIYGFEMLGFLFDGDGTNDLDLDLREDVIPNSIRSMLINRMETLMKYLQCPPSQANQPPIHLSNGLLNKPIGRERLAILKFLVHLMTFHQDVELIDALIQSGVLGKVFDLFWEYRWNSFLHHYVCQIVTQIAKITKSSNSAKFVLIDYDFLGRIMDAFENPDKKCGYLGHVAKITSAWVESLETNERIKSLVPELEEARPGFMEKFYQFIEEKLEAYNTKSTQLLAGVAMPMQTAASYGEQLPEAVHLDKLDSEWWKPSEEFLKELEETGSRTCPLNLEDSSTKEEWSACFKASDPFVGQESVPVNHNTDPWDAFKLGDTDDGGWAQFDQSFASSNNFGVESDVDQFPLHSASSTGVKLSVDDDDDIVNLEK